MRLMITCIAQSMIVQLRKCCNHPYLFGEKRNDNGVFETNDEIVEVIDRVK